MEFHEKLRELRKNKGLTQEELARALYVSRTAVSKWESGRGYPGIDSLRELSRFFSVTVDELICPEEMLSAAEDDKKTFTGGYLSLICGLLDVLPALLLWIPVFGGGGASPASVTLWALGGTAGWRRILFAALLGLTVLNGICGAVISRLDRPVWNRHRRVTGLALSVLCSVVFMLTRQPYPGTFCFALLVVKAVLILRARP